MNSSMQIPIEWAPVMMKCSLYRELAFVPLDLNGMKMKIEKIKLGAGVQID